MPANARTWAVVIVGVAIVLIVLSLTFLSQQIQQGPVPTPTGPIPTTTADNGTEGTVEASDTLEATAES